MKKILFSLLIILVSIPAVVQAKTYDEMTIQEKREYDKNLAELGKGLAEYVGEGGMVNFGASYAIPTNKGWEPGFGIEMINLDGRLSDKPTLFLSSGIEIYFFNANATAYPQFSNTPNYIALALNFGLKWFPETNENVIFPYLLGGLGVVMGSDSNNLYGEDSTEPIGSELGSISWNPDFYAGAGAMVPVSGKFCFYLQFKGEFQGSFSYLPLEAGIEFGGL